MKIGDHITIKYLSAYKKIHVAFFKITKIGHKYVYGITLWSDQENEIREGLKKYSNWSTFPQLRSKLWITKDNVFETQRSD